MNLILDTHTFIWYVENDTQLSDGAKTIIHNLNNNVHVSIASLWEMAIKFNIGKLTLKKSFQQVIDDIHKNGFVLLPIKLVNTFTLSTLPRHHRDPFDRMLISQALAEKMTIVTKDPNFSKYEVKVLW